MKILVTGAAGFIGSTATLRLLARGDEVVGLDNLNDYYEVSLKENRLKRLTSLPGFRFVKLDVADRAGMDKLFADEKFDKVIHLAAQAGVRYSLQNPHAYIESNIVGFTNILEGCRHNKVQHLVYASSSSGSTGWVKTFTRSLPSSRPKPVSRALRCGSMRQSAVTRICSPTSSAAC